MARARTPQHEDLQDGEVVTDVTGRRGSLRMDGDEHRLIATFDEGVWTLPISSLERRADGWYLPHDVTALEGRLKVVPVVQEELRVGKIEHERQVRIRKVVETRTEDVELSLRRSEVEVERVPIGEPVSEAPQTRTEGDVTIIPVLEERLVVEKRLFLKEELHVRLRPTSEPFREQVTLREEVVTVERDDA
jgi:uncharacterized protein (TIGR02271 family)